MNKTCTTCNWEPDWDRSFTLGNALYGKCTKIPNFLNITLIKDSYDKTFWSHNGNYDEVENCNMWEAKDE